MGNLNGVPLNLKEMGYCGRHTNIIAHRDSKLDSLIPA